MNTGEYFLVSWPAGEAHDLVTGRALGSTNGFSGAALKCVYNMQLPTENEIQKTYIKDSITFCSVTYFVTYFVGSCTLMFAIHVISPI